MDLLPPAARRAAASAHSWGKLIDALRSERLALDSVGCDSSKQSEAIRYGMRQELHQARLIEKEMRRDD